MQSGKRFEIDHSARFYPIMATKKAQSIFCVGAKLFSAVDKDVLQRAANDVMPRFLAYKVRLKKGYGWHYLEENNAEVKVFEIGKLLSPIDSRLTNGYLFRLSCSGCEIRLEIMHLLTDANGAMDFLKTILARYAQLLGEDVDLSCVIDWQGTPTDAECEDSFVKYYKPIKLKDLKLKDLAGQVPHHIDGTLRKDGYTKDVFVADTTSILANAKSVGSTFTSYMTGVLAYSIASISQSDKPMVLMIPVNLRKLFASVTMKNFVTFVRIVINPNECKTLEEYVNQASVQLKEKSSKEKMEAFISTSVKAQKNVILRAAPLFMKAFFMKLGRLFMRSRQTIIYSNIGVVNMPENAGVERFEFVPNVSKNNTQNLASVTLNNKTSFTFTRYIEQTSLQDAFCKTLRDCGVEIDRQ